MSDMTHDFTPTEQLVLEVLQARCVRIGEEQWFFDNRFKPVLRRLEARGFIGFQSHVSGSQAVWLNRDSLPWAKFFDPRPAEYRDPARDIAAQREALKEIWQNDETAATELYPIGVFQGLVDELDADTEPWVTAASITEAIEENREKYRSLYQDAAAAADLSRYRRAVGTRDQPTALRVLIGWAAVAVAWVAAVMGFMWGVVYPDAAMTLLTWAGGVAFAVMCPFASWGVWQEAKNRAAERRGVSAEMKRNEISE